MRHVSAFAALTLCLAAAGCANDAPAGVQLASAATAGAAASAPAAGGQVCTRETKTGSHVATTVCRPAADGHGGVALEGMIREDATTLNRTNGGFGR